MRDKIVLIPGFRKCGTTSLYDILAETESFNLCKVKEPQLLLSESIRKEKSFYLDNFSSANKPILDASTYYIWNPETFDFALSEFSEVKIIIMIRNPIERFYSAYYHNKNKIENSESRTIEEIVSEFISNSGEQERVSSVINTVDESFYKRNGLLHTGEDTLDISPNYHYITEGYYRKRISYLENNSIKHIVITFEEFIYEFADSMKTICDFLEVKIPEKLSLIKSNESRKKSKLIYNIRKIAPFSKKIIPEMLTRKIRDYLEPKQKNDKGIERERLALIYKDEMDYWISKNSKAAKYWK